MVTDRHVLLWRPAYKEGIEEPPPLKRKTYASFKRAWDEMHVRQKNGAHWTAIVSDDRRRNG